MSNKTKKVKTGTERFNECARMLYTINGYEVPEGYDFQSATHPQEKLMFAIAVRTYNFWSKAIKDDEAIQ